MCERSCRFCHWNWLGKCVNTKGNYGENVSTEQEEIKNCNEFITEEDWERQESKPLSQERCMELLNLLIKDLLFEKHDKTVIERLLYIGFTENELINKFNFNKNDVQEVSSYISEEKTK